MGSGKSTLGRALADRAGLEHLDLDDMVEAARGLAIPEIFAFEGESGFRALEQHALAGALCGRPAVVSTGGGVVTGESNRDLLAASDALVVWLDAPVEVLARRVEGGATRPLLTGDDVEGALRTVIAERADWYAEVADLRIDTSDTDVEDCVERIEAVCARRTARPLTCG